DATVCFDPHLLRVAAAWTGPFVTWPLEKDGIAGLPNVAGKLAFKNAAQPGWGDPKDPRPLPYGPLPRERGHWKGLYTHGKKAVLSYTVGAAEVLELHGFENGSFTRTIRVQNVAAPLSVLLGPAGLEPGLIGEGAALRKRDDRVELEVTRPGTFKISIPKAEVAPPEDLDALTKGGPAKWTETVVTQGVVGKEPGAYQLDTLTVPYENPWDSYMRIAALDFFPDGRAAVATLDGDVWIVSGIDAKLEKLTWKRFAAGLYQPMGLRVVEGKIYALGRDQITRLHDLNGDGEADFYENFNNDCMLGPSYGEYAMDLQVGPEGDFYYAKAGTMGYGGATPHNGCILKVSKDGSKLEIFALGFRAPMGLCVGPDGFVTATDQQGNYMAECPVVRVKKGGFYGFILDHHPETKTMHREPPITWLPMDVDNSSGGQVWVTDDRWGPLKGRLVHTSYGQSRLLLMLMDRERSQGGVVRFPFTFASGIMRAQFNPVDGQLYAAGLRGWQTTGVKDGCLQRVRYTGKPAHLPLALKVRKTGIDLEFTDALDKEVASDADSYSAQWFHVVSTPDYGSPEFNATDHTKRGRQKVAITAAKLHDDGKTVSLEIEGFRPVTNLLIKYSLRGADGAKVQNEVSLTINKLPD
ncbi:MAG: heme-binding protein, partial [Planctomycetes bacterium]|nr:heme-binding protein [Planctomycetota bacterium]